ENISRAKGQGRLSAAAGSKIVEQVRKDFLAASGADIGKMKLGDLVASPNGTGKVIWFHPDGEAEIDRDLRAPIGKPTRIE
ncbi:hypothetical protein IID22_02265, partial [Patescibacteria group bacterium]|nr:hypothetical protein [Patescibacteria group bacterium]